MHIKQYKTRNQISRNELSKSFHLGTFTESRKYAKPLNWHGTFVDNNDDRSR